MTATYTFDVFSSLDGYGAAGGDWTGYWGKQGPELLDHRLNLYGEEQRMVSGPTVRAFTQLLASSTEDSEVRDPWVTRMVNMPATVVSTTLEEPVDWPNATIVSGDAVDIVTRLQRGSRRAVALAQQPVDEPGADGRRLTDAVTVTLHTV